MDIIKTFVINETSHQIDVLFNQSGDTVFRAEQIGKVLGLVNVRQAIKEFDGSQKGVISTDTPGGIQEITVLSEEGVYELLFQSRKPIAKVFRRWVCKVLTEIRERGKYEIENHAKRIVEQKEKEIENLKADLSENRFELNKTLEIRQKEIEAIKTDTVELIKEQTKDECTSEKHAMFLKTTKNCKVVYFGQIRKQDGKTLVKIGSTNNLTRRASDHERNFGSFQIFDVYPVQRHEDFERFLLKKGNFQSSRYRSDIAPNVRSTEVFLFSNEMIATLISTAQRNCSKYDQTKDELKIQQLTSTINKIADNFDIDIDEYRSEGEAESDNENATDSVLGKRKYTAVSGFGRKIQRYSADGKTLLKTYDGMNKVIEDTESAGSKLAVSSIRTHIANSQPYKGYRYAYLDRSLPNETVQTLSESAQEKKYKTGPIAKLNAGKTKVIAVFPDSTTAQKQTSYNSIAGFIKAMDKDREIQGHYYDRWNLLSDAMRDAFDKSLMPDMNENRAQKVQQIQGGQVVKTWNSKDEICRVFKMTLRTLKDAVNGQTELRGSKWVYC